MISQIGVYAKVYKSIGGVYPAGPPWVAMLQFLAWQCCRTGMHLGYQSNSRPTAGEHAHMMSWRGGARENDTHRFP